MEALIKPVHLSKRAIKDLIKIKEFNSELLGSLKAEKIIDSLFNSMAILETPNNNFSQIGAIDDDFSHLKKEYRKLIEHHYKITYREGKTKIYVVRVFDTRQHPNRNK